MPSPLAKAEGTTTSEVIREAPRRFLKAVGGRSDVT
jgi:hypothetical protein